MAKPKPIVPSVFLGTAVPESLVKAIDDFRFARRLSSRSKAVRMLLEAGLERLARPRPTDAEPRAKRKADDQGGTAP